MLSEHPQGVIRLTRIISAYQWSFQPDLINPPNTGIHYRQVKLSQRFAVYVSKWCRMCTNVLWMSLHHYLCDLISLFSDSQTIENRPRLRSSSDTTKLLVPHSRKRAGDHSFVVAAPRLWNELPVQLREAVSVPVFKRLLITHLYKF